MPRYRLTIAYDGTDFHGWQKQRRPHPDGGPGEILRTVQGEIERAVREVVRIDADVTGASRTDAGVHAAAQCAAFTAPPDRLGPPDERLAEALTSRLPDDAQILDARPVRDDFDPIADCVSKGYRYTLFTGRRPPLWDRRFVHHCRADLDLDHMREVAATIVGTHDFEAFAKAGHGRASTVRTVLNCAVTPLDDRRIAIDVSADGFLYNMVRIIAGTLVDAGRGRLTTQDVRAALDSRDRALVGPTLPPTGLRLEWIRYPDDQPQHQPPPPPKHEP